MGNLTAAACGRNRRAGFSAAVEKPEEERKPERFFANRKVAKPDRRCLIIHTIEDKSIERDSGISKRTFSIP
jgi:hypothetical protein